MTAVQVSTKTFELAHPFEFKGVTYTEFVMRRPKVRDLRAFLKDIERDAVNAMEKVLANLAEIDEKVIAEVDVEDFGPMKAWFENFLKPMLGASNE